VPGRTENPSNLSSVLSQRFDEKLRRLALVIPAEAGIHDRAFDPAPPLDARLRGHDDALLARRILRGLMRRDTSGRPSRRRQNPSRRFAPQEAAPHDERFCCRFQMHFPLALRRPHLFAAVSKGARRFMLLPLPLTRTIHKPRTALCENVPRLEQGPIFWAPYRGCAAAPACPSIRARRKRHSQ
jgi:hypothetical protein